MPSRRLAVTLLESPACASRTSHIRFGSWGINPFETAAGSTNSCRITIFGQLTKFVSTRQPMWSIGAFCARTSMTFGSKADAAKLLNTPAEDTIEGLRDRAVLSVGLQVGLRRAEIAALGRGPASEPGFDSLRIVRKGCRRDALAILPNVAQHIRLS
jgi:hypothetical protein